MGVRRYSRDFDRRRWEERFDALQRECHNAYLSPTIGELIDHGINLAKWRCRGVGWKDDGKVECWHGSKAMFRLDRYPRAVRVFEIRKRNRCGECGRGVPFLELWPHD